jgi:hypothetical protein
VFKKLIEGSTSKSPEFEWQAIEFDLKKFSTQTLQLRIYQRVLVADCLPSNAYWKALELK